MATISKIGFCKYRLLEGGQDSYVDANAKEDVAKNRGVQFKFDYSWTGNICTISNIEWNGVKINVNSTTGERTVEAINLSSCYNVRTFPDNDEKYLTILFNGSELVFDENGVEVGTQSVNQYGDENYSKQYTINNAQYMAASFEYSYSTEYVEYYISISNIKIPKTSKYEHNVIFTENGLNELLTNIKNYPVTSIEGTAPTGQQPYITVHHGSDSNTAGTKIKVGSVITFPASQDNDSTGTFRVSIDGTESVVSIKGFGSGSSGDITLGGDLLPSQNNTYSIGNSNIKWKDLYLSGTATTNSISTTNLTVNGHNVTNLIPSQDGYKYQFWRGGGSDGDPEWSNILTSSSGARLILSNNNAKGESGSCGYFHFAGSDYTSSTCYSASSAYIECSKDATRNKTELAITVYKNEGANTSDYTSIKAVYDQAYTSTASNFEDNQYYKSVHRLYTNASCTMGNLFIDSTAGNDNSSEPTILDSAFYCKGSGYFKKNLRGHKVFNAVFNDYAEYRTTINLAPGHVVIDQDDGSLACSSTRLQPGAQVISDTFGTCMGQTDTAKTPLAVAGRVLVYTYQPRENYHAGMAVCSAPDGTVDIMTREEIRDYPDCIIGIVSEIPQYEIWGSDNVKVDGRIWIKVK